jgi:toxin ParE1/3/4
MAFRKENPKLGKRRDDIKPGYYSFPEGRHLIFYTISKSSIDIIGIPHQSMGIISHFEEVS